MQTRPPRPTGITIIAVLVILGGIVGLLVSLAVFALSAFVAGIGSTFLGSVGAIIGGIFLVFSLLWLAVGVGFLHGKGWAWILGMIVVVLSLIGSVGALVISPVSAVGGLLWNGLLLYYLTRPRVKAFFGKGGPLAFPVYSAGPQYGQPPMPGSYQGFNQQPTTTNVPSYSQPPASAPTLTFNPLPAGTSTPASQIGSNNSPSVVQAIVSCPNCGSRLAIGQHNCPACGASV